MTFACVVWWSCLRKSVHPNSGSASIACQCTFTSARSSSAAESACAQAGGLAEHCTGGLAHVRYTVLEVACASEEKVLRLLREGDGREVTAHLRDGWVDTHACPGDVVHLLAALEEAGGESHAVCDCSTGDRQKRTLRGGAHNAPHALAVARPCYTSQSLPLSYTWQLC